MSGNTLAVVQIVLILVALAGVIRTGVLMRRADRSADQERQNHALVSELRERVAYAQGRYDKTVQLRPVFEHLVRGEHDQALEVMRAVVTDEQARASAATSRSAEDAR